jgi:hypothetical protein
MKIRPVGAKMFHADRHTLRSYKSLFVILRTRPKSSKINHVYDATVNLTVGL